MTGYYSEKLSGVRLRRCYELASERVMRYLEAEILHAVGRLRSADTVLELGCGYGRLVGRLARDGRRVVGIDTAFASLALARSVVGAGYGCEFVQTDAIELGLRDASFDAVACLQNGICAFGVDPVSVLEEALRVTRGGGTVLLASYADAFWPERLAWFEAQAAEGLVGRVDRNASGGGVIVCEDGFRSGRMTAGDFRALCSRAGVAPRLDEVDGSSLFCEIRKPPAWRPPSGRPA